MVVLLKLLFRMVIPDATKWSRHRFNGTCGHFLGFRINAILIYAITPKSPTGDMIWADYFTEYGYSVSQTAWYTEEKRPWWLEGDEAIQNNINEKPTFQTSLHGRPAQVPVPPLVEALYANDYAVNGHTYGMSFAELAQWHKHECKCKKEEDIHQTLGVARVETWWETCNSFPWWHPGMAVDPPNCGSGGHRRSSGESSGESHHPQITVVNVSDIKTTMAVQKPLIYNEKNAYITEFGMRFGYALMISCIFIPLFLLCRHILHGLIHNGFPSAKSKHEAEADVEAANEAYKEELRKARNGENAKTDQAASQLNAAECQLKICEARAEAFVDLEELTFDMFGNPMGYWWAKFYFWIWAGACAWVTPGGAQNAELGQTSIQVMLLLAALMCTMVYYWGSWSYHWVYPVILGPKWIYAHLREKESRGVITAEDVEEEFDHRERVEAKRASIVLMPDGPEKDAELAALATMETKWMPEGPEKDAAVDALKKLEAERCRFAAMSDGPEKDAALATLAKLEAEIEGLEEETVGEDKKNKWITYMFRLLSGFEQIVATWAFAFTNFWIGRVVVQQFFLSNMQNQVTQRVGLPLTLSHPFSPLPSLLTVVLLKVAVCELGFSVLTPRVSEPTRGTHLWAPTPVSPFGRCFMFISVFVTTYGVAKYLVDKAVDHSKKLGHLLDRTRKLQMLAREMGHDGHDERENFQKEVTAVEQQNVTAMMRGFALSTSFVPALSITIALAIEEHFQACFYVLAIQYIKVIHSEEVPDSDTEEVQLAEIMQQYSGLDGAPCCNFYECDNSDIWGIKSVSLFVGAAMCTFVIFLLTWVLHHCCPKFDLETQLAKEEEGYIDERESEFDPELHKTTTAANFISFTKSNDQDDQRELDISEPDTVEAEVELPSMGDSKRVVDAPTVTLTI